MFTVYRSDTGEYNQICSDNWTTKHSDVVCASMGYVAASVMDASNEESSKIEGSFYALKNDTTDEHDLNYKTLLVNLVKSNQTCESGKLVAITCQDFSKFSVALIVHCIILYG